VITTHILDTAIGKPAAGVRVALLRIDNAIRTVIGSGVTDADGRLKDLVPATAEMKAGVFELAFETGTYFLGRGVKPFHPRVTITIEITDPKQHHHVPLLISPFGYTTYRGS
jgi:5-hydroxyisourate hydrolase